MSPRYWILTVLAAGLIAAHPMGNFSVSHYTRFDVNARGVEMTYVLDLAELPTFDLLRQWGLERTSARADLDRKAVRAGPRMDRQSSDHVQRLARETEIPEGGSGSRGWSRQSPYRAHHFTFASGCTPGKLDSKIGISPSVQAGKKL